MRRPQPTERCSRGRPTRGFSVRPEVPDLPEKKADPGVPRGGSGAATDPDEAVRVGDQGRRRRRPLGARGAAARCSSGRAEAGGGRAARDGQEGALERLDSRGRRFRTVALEVPPERLGQTSWDRPAHVLATLKVAQVREIAQGRPGTWQAKRPGRCGLPRPGVHPAPPPGNRPVRSCPRQPGNLPRPRAREVRRRPAPLRRAGAARLPRLRRLQPGLHAGTLRRVWPRPADRLLVRQPQHLPELHGQADGKHGRIPGRSGPAQRPPPAIRPDAALRASQARCLQGRCADGHRAHLRRERLRALSRSSQWGLEHDVSPIDSTISFIVTQSSAAFCPRHGTSAGHARATARTERPTRLSGLGRSAHSEDQRRVTASRRCR